MAKVYSNNSGLIDEYEIYRSKVKKGAKFSLFSLIIGGIIWLIASGINPYMASSISPFIMFFVFGGFIYSGINSQRAKILDVGITGEEDIQEIIETLPDDYYGISNVNVWFEGKKSELDMVVVGKNGVFIIETKNHNGRITGDASDHDLTQRKVGRKGTPYSKDFYNPIKQVGTHTYKLSNFLKTQGIHVWVQRMVYFANSEAVVDIDKISKTPVFCKYYDEEDDLCDYITSYPSKSQLPDNIINKIVQLLTD